ncbi:MAG: hypothetical protein ACRDRH_13855 [Pseudonocardia sp.]
MTTTPAEPHALLSDTAVLERTATQRADRFAGVFSSATVYRYVLSPAPHSGAPRRSRRGRFP